MGESLERRLHELRESAKEYAQAEAERTYLEHYRKSKLAILMKEALSQGFETAAAQEREARSHAEYVQLLEGLREATEKAERLRWELMIARQGANLWQTMQANQRAERRGYGA